MIASGDFGEERAAFRSTPPCKARSTGELQELPWCCESGDATGMGQDLRASTEPCGWQDWLGAHSVTSFLILQSCSVITGSCAYSQECSLSGWSCPAQPSSCIPSPRGWCSASCRRSLLFWINLGRSDPVFWQIWRVVPSISVASGMVPYCINSDLCYFTLHFLLCPWVKIINSCWFTALNFSGFPSFLFYFFLKLEVSFKTTFRFLHKNSLRGGISLLFFMVEE